VECRIPPKRREGRVERSVVVRRHICCAPWRRVQRRGCRLAKECQAHRGMPVPSHRKDDAYTAIAHVLASNYPEITEREPAHVQ
jgi:hypothetical protein